MKTYLRLAAFALETRKGLSNHLSCNGALKSCREVGVSNLQNSYIDGKDLDIKFELNPINRNIAEIIASNIARSLKTIT